MDELANKVVEINGLPVLSVEVEATDMAQLRKLVDELRHQLEEGIIVLGSKNGQKVQFVASVSKKYVEEGFHAGKLIKEVGKLCVVVEVAVVPISRKQVENLLNG